MNTGKGRAWGLTATVLLHVAAALVLLQGLAPHAKPGQPRSSSIRMNLLATTPAHQPVPPQMQEPVLATPPRPAMPPSLVVTPAVSLLASAAEAVAMVAPAAPSPSPSPATSPSNAPPTAVAPPPVLAAAPAASLREPEYRAATPPDRACTDRHMARHYPQMLRERGIEGQVMLRVRVDERGQAAEVVVQGGSGWRLLDEAAQLLARGCPYVPARRGDQALASWVEYPVRFALNATP